MLPKSRIVRLEGEAYAAFLREVFELDNWRCKICCRTVPLQGHHMQKRSQGRLDVVENVISLCYRCHEWVERRRMIVEPVEMKARLITWRWAA